MKYIHTHIHKMGCYSTIKKNEILPFAATWMDLLGRYYAKWNKSDRERQILDDIIYMWKLKYDTNELIYETETDSQT